MQHQATVTSQRKRVKHHCGHFLGELATDGTLYLACGRCKELAELVLEPPPTDLRVRRRRVCPRSPRGA